MSREIGSLLIGCVIIFLYLISDYIIDLIISKKYKIERKKNENK